MNASIGNRTEATVTVFAKASILSMLFNYWKGSNPTEDLANLDERFNLHLELFLARCLQHIPRNFEVNVLIPDADFKAIGALGAFLDVESDDYARALASHGLDHLSMYDVIVQALRDRGQVVHNELLPRATSMVLQYKREAIYLLQLRHNFLPMMVFGRITDFQDLGDVSRMKNNVLRVTMPVDLGLSDARGESSVDEEQLKTWTKWLRAAIETRTTLREMGITPAYNDSMLTTLSLLDFGQSQIFAMPLATLTPRQKLIREFAEAYEQVQQKQ